MVVELFGIFPYIYGSRKFVTAFSMGHHCPITNCSYRTYWQEYAVDFLQSSAVLYLIGGKKQIKHIYI
jgi:hypothetical protein